MAAWRIGGSVVGGRFRSAGAWLCAAVLLAGLSLAGTGLLDVRAQTGQQPQPGDSRQAGGQQATQPNAQSSDSSTAPSDSATAPSDGADELLKEFPADPASKAATDPRDGHPANEPAYVPQPEDTVPAENVAQPAAAQPAAAVSPAPVAPPVLIELPDDPKQRQVAIECNDLLTMATDLKAVVDKSSKDQLSLDVVRKAGQLEQYARKVRSGAAQVAGK